MARRIASALGAVHDRGAVHRDVKPANVFLVAGDPAQSKLLDLGIALRQLRTVALTRTGTLLGTVGYMAPEQAHGWRDLDARVDIFALGCVLFECLTGRPAFRGEHVVAIMAKILLEDAPRVRTIRPELPESVEALVARMLSKPRDDRFESAASVLAAIDALGDLRGSILPTVVAANRQPSEQLTGDELRVVSVILARTDPASLAVAATALDRSVPSERAELESVARRFGGEPSELADGTLLVTLAGHEHATDRAARAACCALALAEAMPGPRVALATGRAAGTAGFRAGPVIDRAAQLLETADANGVATDELTAALLDSQFEVSGDSARLTLRLRDREDRGARTLLGKETPTVGRDKELALLEATMNECLSEPVSRVAIVTAPAGTGKSRLRYDVLLAAWAGGRSRGARAGPRHRVRHRLRSDGTVRALADRARATACARSARARGEGARAARTVARGAPRGHRSPPREVRSARRPRGDRSRPDDDSRRPRAHRADCRDLARPRGPPRVREHRRERPNPDARGGSYVVGLERRSPTVVLRAPSARTLSSMWLAGIRALLAPGCSVSGEGTGSTGGVPRPSLEAWSFVDLRAERR